jgi:hypothetical protein
MTGRWRKLHYAELNNFYSSSHIVGVIKLRRIGWAGMKYAWGRYYIHIKYWLGKLQGRAQSEDLGVNGKKVLKCIVEY